MIAIRMFGLGCIALAAGLTAYNMQWSEAAPDLAAMPDPEMAAVPLITVEAVDAEPEPLDTPVRLTISRGDTLMNLITSTGVDRGQAHKAIQALSKVYDPRRIKPGQNIDLLIREAEEGAQIQELRFAASITEEALVTPGDGKAFNAVMEEHPLTRQLVRAEGKIKSSLYVAAVEAGMPPKVLGKLINVFAFDVDFQREVRKGDTFAIMYEELMDEDGTVVDTGEVLIGEMTLSGDTKRLYRFKDGDGFYDYYDEKGRSVRKALMRTPIDGARISSGFGKRKHPILGYTKQHSGTDFAARRGTPIYAAGNGVVEVAGRNGGYGNYIRIRHNGTYKTAYAHLHKFAKGIRKGRRVKQKQVIGYVGSTGRSTGPHLHYEVHKNGRKVNPLSVKLPTGKTLKGKELAAFQKEAGSLDSRYAALPASIELARAAEAGEQ